MDNIKKYLTNALVLAPYDSKKCLLFYVLATLSALEAMLAQKDERDKERAIYYISKILLDYETSFIPLNILCPNPIYMEELQNG